MERRRHVFVYIYGAIASVSLLIVCARTGVFNTPDFLQFLEKRWTSIKLEKSKAMHSFERRPSDSVHLLTLNYHNRLQFWSDEKTKSQVYSLLSKYQGPIFLGLDPVMLENDQKLNSLLKQPNVIRPFIVETGDPREAAQKFSSIEAASRRLEVAPSSLYELPPDSDRREVTPNSVDYFKPPGFAGFLEIQQDQSAQFLNSYRLTMPATKAELKNGHVDVEKYELPSPVLPALTLLHHCQNYSFARNNILKLENCDSGKNSSLGPLPDPLPLFFYQFPFQRFGRENLDYLPTTDRALLIVTLRDPNSVLASSVGTKVTMADVIATSVSNILQNDFPWRDSRVSFAELAFFFLSLLGFGFVTVRRKLQTCVSVILGTLTFFVAADYLATLLGNIETQPILIFSSLGFVGIVGIATRSIVDARERLLFERALSGYVSPERLKRLLSGEEKLALGGQLKSLTMILIDIVGFHKMAQRMQIEDVFKLIQQFFSMTDSLIFKFGGVIDKKTGDGLLAFFGDHEAASEKDAAIAAVRSALEIQKTIATLPTKEPLQLRIGINTGKVLIGNTGSEKHFNYTMLGTEVNFTQRLEAACPPGQVLLGAHTAELVRDHFKLEELQIKVKHETDLYLAYLVKDALASRTSAA